MILKLSDLVRNPRLFERLKKRSTLICPLCSKPIDPSKELDGHLETLKRYKGKPCHDDCYYEALGNEIEQHPIGGGGIRRS